MTVLATLLLIIATSQFNCILAIDDVPSNYISTKPLKSLFCNTCAVLSTIVNETLYDDSKDFESLVGFRLDSNGKKIRKQSGWLKLFLALEDVCDDWKDKHRVAKRKNEYLYLIENEVVNAMAQIERKRKEKLEKEASDRLNKQWDQEWEIEKLKQEILWNATHDDDGNLLNNDTDTDTNQTDIDNIINDTVNDTADINTSDEQDQNKKDEPETDEPDDADTDTEVPVAKKYFYEKKPKLVKKKSKPQKIVKEMCYFLNEKFDEWLHGKQQTIPKQMKEGDKIKDYLEPLLFCLEDKICKTAMFDITPKIYKFKKELRLPSKPKRTWTPPVKENIVELDYDEQMEDDIDDDMNATNITQPQNVNDVNDVDGEINTDTNENDVDNTDDEIATDDSKNDNEPKSEL